MISEDFPDIHSDLEQSIQILEHVQPAKANQKPDSQYSRI